MCRLIFSSWGRMREELLASSPFLLLLLLHLAISPFQDHKAKKKEEEEAKKREK